MTKTTYPASASQLVLQAETAADLMTPNPVSIPADAPVEEAVAFLTDKGFSAAPVIDRAGRPVGVVSRADIVIHDRETVNYLKPVPDDAEAEAPAGAGELTTEASAPVCVRDIMTPVVFSVRPDAPAARVVEDILSWDVHRLFVVDGGVLVGVISTLDVLRRLRP